MNVSILGCGWLGLPLGKALAEQGHTVIGTTTSEAKLPVLRQAGIQPVLLNFNPEPTGNLAALLNAEVLIISIPPRASSQGDDFHPQQIRQLLHQMTDFRGKLIYISSTSVYPETSTELDEYGPTLENHPLITVEHLLQESTFPLTVLRCGGLMGYDRIAGKYFIGKTVDTGDVPVNFVHRDDVIGIIEAVLQQDVWNETFNVVAPEHPVRRAIYERNAEQHGWAPPIFKTPEAPVPFKVISSEKLITQLAYTFQYPDPLAFP
ncbi:NAD(P)-dependent oxidoreductase [Siphonobacter sp. BAB-5385]|uniref:NAD(P)H-binding protein n=1 Tax=Siphonobacter sp. BAB-5385 TaxID=1864822 RepID=UPI000B9E2635|nr:NAD(P)H-binding protein [Siphonobacter sp. BAB-5385]OZI07192.1 NAD(P)-dependent oxidoreductase [Siphonobacter sp. BAB-5385]